MPALLSPKTSPNTTSFHKPKKSHETLVTKDATNLGESLLRQARDCIALGENPNKALDFATRAVTYFSSSSGSGLEVATCRHVAAAIYSSVGRFGEAIHELELAIDNVDIGNGSGHGMVKFDGYM